MKSREKRRECVTTCSDPGVVLQLPNIQQTSEFYFGLRDRRRNTKLVTDAEDGNGSPSTTEENLDLFRGTEVGR